jgi:hypothetical protein
MNLGKFQPLIAGTVGFFKQNSSMKKIGIKIVFSYVLFIFVATGCVGTKVNKNKTIVSTVPSKIENLDSTNKTNIPKLFDLSPEGNKWVDSL